MSEEVNELPHANDRLLFYPGRNVSQDWSDRIDRFDYSLSDIGSDLLVASMAKQIERNFQTFFGAAADVVGAAVTLEIARTLGRKYGGRGYATFLRSRGSEGRGTPALMAEYQDLAHAIRGPKHTAALFAQYDDRRCVIRRGACVYFSEEFPEHAPYTGAFEAGCMDGYKDVDENLLDVEVLSCRWQGAPSCETIITFR
jgi:hypothetical protein